MYHIIADLETRFRNLKEVRQFMQNSYFTPKIPITHMLEEDQPTPRICVAETIENCVTSIGIVGTFRRCLAENDSAKSYENDNEAYPILVVKFPDNLDYIKPTPAQVPDVESTGEYWLLNPARPESIKLKWLSARSIIYDENGPKITCTKITFLSATDGYDHPWLNRKGHPINCSDMGPEPWPGNLNTFHENAKAFLYYESRIRGKVVYAVPESNGYALCFLVTHTSQNFNVNFQFPYRAPIDSLRPFSGFCDSSGKMLFHHDDVWVTIGDTDRKIASIYAPLHKRPGIQLLNETTPRDLAEILTGKQTKISKIPVVYDAND